MHVVHVRLSCGCTVWKRQDTYRCLPAVFDVDSPVSPKNYSK